VHDPVTVAAAAVPDLTVSGEPLPGMLLDWRWLDRERGRWVALVRVRTATLLQHERWIEGRHLRRVATRVATQDAETEPEGPVSWGEARPEGCEPPTDRVPSGGPCGSIGVRFVGEWIAPNGPER